MSSSVITSVAQVNPTWLTAVLRRSGALSAGEVAGFAEVAATNRELSTNARLLLDYSPDAAGDRPRRLFLKIVEMDQEDEWLQASEVYYYTRDYVGVPDVPLLRCYDAQYDEAAGCFHLLLDDVTETHLRAAEKPVTREYALALAEGLAALHAPWWGRQRLEAGGAPPHEPATIERFVAIARPGIPHILASCSGDMQPHWPQLLRDIFAHHPAALVARNEAGRSGDGAGFTLIHGDAGKSNILTPKTGDRPLYIIDRGPFDWSLTSWLGVYDLAYAMVLDWPIAQRRELELATLRRYYEQLIALGVDNYSWLQLYEDYRLMAVMGVYIATEWCRGGPHERNKHIFCPYLRRSLTAYEDLACDWHRV